MTNEQVLEQQVEALEKLLQLKQAVIEELEAKVQKLQSAQTITSIPSVWTVPYQVPSWQCTDGNPHQYPQTWAGTMPPSCTKCGTQLSGSSWTLGGAGISIGGGAGGYGGNITLTDGQGFVSNLPQNSVGYLQPLSDNNIGSVIPLNTAIKQ